MWRDSFHSLESDRFLKSSGIRLTWSLTPHPPAARIATWHRRPPSDDPSAPSRRASPRRHRLPSIGRSGQGLHLSRTMLSNQKLPYVGRFACDWLRLSTTDPDAARTSNLTGPPLTADPRCLPRPRHHQANNEDGSRKRDEEPSPACGRPGDEAER